MHKEQILPYNCNDKRQPENIDMDLTQLIILLLLGILRNLSVTESCKFGGEGCDYPCHCQDNAVCNVHDGSCRYGCDDGDLRQPGDYWYTGGWSGYGCQMGNVAYGKRTREYGGYGQWPSTNAVDGGHDPVMTNGTCTHPGVSGDVPAWWEVDLGAMYVVSSINITNRGDCCQDRTAHLNIYISETQDEESVETLCKTVLTEGRLNNTYVHCVQPIKGRYVKLKRLTYASVYQRQWMNFCEVQVYGYLYHDCPGGYFGVACGTECNCPECPYCRCGYITGDCTRGQCLPGWIGDYCQTPCRDGYFGEGCGSLCNCRSSCNHINGECMGGQCTDGWMGRNCQITCDSGYFGEACGIACNCDGLCNHVTGECLGGQCQAGWLGSNCQTQCQDGYFGEGCGSVCNCKSTCNHITGECRDGQCLDGWKGSSCQTPCESGKWGANCQVFCHCSDEQEVCNRFNGACQSGCHMSYGGAGCNFALPRLDNVIVLSSASRTSLTIRFPAWSPSNGGGETPAGYEIQWRLNDNSTWIPSTQLQHNGETEYSAVLKGLAPDTLYHVNIIPYIEDDGVRYNGFAAEGGPFRTLRYDTTNPSSIIVGVVVALVFVLILAIAIVLLLRRHLKRRKDDNQNPMVFAAGNPSFDTEHGNENPAYENSNIELRNKAANDEVRDGLTKRGDAQNVNGVRKPAIAPKPKMEDKLEETPVKVDIATENSHSVSSTSDDHIYGNESLLGRPVGVDELSVYIDEMLKRQDGFKEEYMEIPTAVTATISEARKTKSKTLNRFNNICAYDHSRVVLKVLSDGDRSDYINANYIDKYKDDTRGYIAAQGPTKSTVADMWAMVWQSESNRIVMVTKLIEAGKVKCEQYWPSQGAMEFGRFKVSLADTEKFADYTIRVLSLSYDGGTPRPVYQFHFTGWPDNGIPDEATSLLDFRRKVRSHDNISKGPIIVHCSAGVGRTGTYMAVDYLLDQAKVEEKVDVFTYTALMRTNRMRMIQTVEQYEFVYKALLDALQTGETAVPSNEMEACYPELKQEKNGKNAIEEQFELLQCVKPSRKPKPNDSALDPENIAKNRDRNVVPTYKHRIYLSTSAVEKNNYINAVFVDGYRERQAYITTQLPLPSTVGDLWRLLRDQKCSCIITLEQPDPKDENTPVFWPTDKDDPMILGQLSVELLKEECLDEGAINMMEFEIAALNKDAQNVRMYQFMLWSAQTGTPTSLEKTLLLLDHAQRWQLRSGLRPLCFLCKYGYQRSGLMTAACYMLEKLKVDREVDVFQAVKKIRIPRPELVTSLVQYEFLYELAIAYINSCEDYANFK